MKKTAAESDVKIVAGDTKVVEKGKGDKIFINTTGVGILIHEDVNISSSNAKKGDCVIVTGTIGDHEISIIKDREGIELDADIVSDCAPLNKMIEELIKNKVRINVMRDPTRGGLATVLNEIAYSSNVIIEIDENNIPVKREVRTACDILGFDLFYLANEGKMVIIADSNDKDKIIDILKTFKEGKDASVIGYVREKGEGKVILNTKTGGKRILLIPEGEQLPRIC